MGPLSLWSEASSSQGADLTQGMARGRAVLAGARTRSQVRHLTTEHSRLAAAWFWTGEMQLALAKVIAASAQRPADCGAGPRFESHPPEAGLWNSHSIQHVFTVSRLRFTCFSAMLTCPAV